MREEEEDEQAGTEVNDWHPGEAVTAAAKQTGESWGERQEGAVSSDQVPHSGMGTGAFA